MKKLVVQFDSSHGMSLEEELLFEMLPSGWARFERIAQDGTEEALECKRGSIWDLYQVLYTPSVKTRVVVEEEDFSLVVAMSDEIEHFLSMGYGRVTLFDALEEILALYPAWEEIEREFGIAA